MVLMLWPALGYRRTGAISVAGRRVLQRSRLLRSGVRRQQLQEFRGPGQLARRVPDPGFAERPPELPFCKWLLRQHCGVDSLADYELQVVLGNKIDVEESKRVV